jgi:hypothetical protein
MVQPARQVSRFRTIQRFQHSLAQQTLRQAGQQRRIGSSGRIVADFSAPRDSVEWAEADPGPAAPGVWHRQHGQHSAFQPEEGQWRQQRWRRSWWRRKRKRRRRNGIVSPAQPGL